MAARPNVSTIDGLLERRRAEQLSSFDDVRYVPYEDKQQVVAAIKGAAKVLTDLPLVETLAQQHRVSVIRLRERFREATDPEPLELAKQTPGVLWNLSLVAPNPTAPTIE